MPNFGSRWREVTSAAFGKGGQGKIFLVSDAQGIVTGNVAAKVLNGGDLTKESARWKRLEEEIEVSKSFDHPNVVKVIDSGYTVGSGYPFFVMPLYADGSLEGYRSKLESPLEILRFFAELCDGVAYVHSKGVIHRDLKPKNILIDDGHPVVGDFGLCFRLEAESLTETMEVATARWFGAPELRDGHNQNPPQSADLYSLGKLLYWLFTGKVYDREESDYGTPQRKLSHALMPFGTLSVANDRLIHAGAFADELVAATVRYDSTERIQTPEQLASKVRAGVDRLDVGGARSRFTPPSKVFLLRRRRLRAFGSLTNARRATRNTAKDRRAFLGCDGCLENDENLSEFQFWLAQRSGSAGSSHSCLSALRQRPTVSIRPREGLSQELATLSRELVLPDFVVLHRVLHRTAGIRCISMQ